MQKVHISREFRNSREEGGGEAQISGQSSWRTIAGEIPWNL